MCIPEQPRRKRVQELRPEDYQRHPIWTYYDDEGDEVVPVEYPSWESEAIGGETVWMNADLELNDRSYCFGALSFHIYYKHVIYLTFVRSDNQRLSLRIDGQGKDAKKLSAIAEFLGKSVESVFPVRYTTPYIYLDGTPIKGIYNPSD